MLISILTTALLGQTSGYWSGYVRGWVADERPGTPVRPSPLVLTREQQRLVFAAQLSAQQAYLNYVSYSLHEKETQERRATEKLLTEQQQKAQLEVSLAQQQAAQAQALAQQLLLAQDQQRLETERKSAAAEQRQQQELQSRADEARAQVERTRLEAREKELLTREADRLAQVRAEEAKSPPRKTEIYSWTDENDVIHYSTRPRTAP
jgi:hypothetical protein